MTLTELVSFINMVGWLFDVVELLAIIVLIRLYRDLKEMFRKEYGPHESKRQ